MRRLAVLALWASCGFGPNDNFTGARQATGIAPWADLGGANLCEKPALLGPADSTPVGFCVPDGTEPRACTQDPDCRPRERCVCGRCTVQYCDSAAGCGKDLSCDFTNKRCARKCSKAARCPKGQTCRRGYCTSKCESSADCSAGELCSPTIKRCVVSACTGDERCLRGEEHCAIQRVPADVREPTLLAGLTPALEAVMFVERRSATGAGIHRAVSRDGLSWTLDPAAPVLAAAPGEPPLGAPSVVETGAELVMFFAIGGAQIGRATSPDGVRWTRDAQPVLGAEQPWEAGAVHAPGAALTSRGLFLFYEGGEGAGIGLARSDDQGRTFRRVSPEPVLTPARIVDPVLWRFVTKVRSPFARVDRDVLGDEVLGLWFSAEGAESSSTEELGVVKPPVANFSIGYAAWNVSLGEGPALEAYPYNPVFDRVLTFLQHLHEGAPAVTRLASGSYVMLYGAFGQKGGYENLGVAINPPEGVEE